MLIKDLVAIIAIALLVIGVGYYFLFYRPNAARKAEEAELESKRSRATGGANLEDDDDEYDD